MKGIGEILVRSLTDHVNPEKIAKDLSGIMRVAEKHNVAIQFPTAWSQFPGGLFYGDPLWADEVAGRHPSVPVILTKMGRSITSYFDTTMTVAMRNINIYLDVVGTNPQHLRFAIDKIGADRIMFGTDWSTTWRWLSVPASLHKIRLKVLEEAKLSKAESELILWKNAAKLFKLDAQISAPAPGVNA
jgi:predicted TIM-barrel fold metal-dependent hydrolase